MNGQHLDRSSIGTVVLVGAGPGDPGLFTLKGYRALRGADMVVYDRLVSGRILAMVPASAESIFVGKRAGFHTHTQDEINSILASSARSGRNVVRLKGGDPFIFGRGGEEALFLDREEIPYSVIPGVSALTGVPAYAGIPLSCEESNSTCLVISGHDALSAHADGLDWENYLAGGGTVVVFMGARNLKAICGVLQQKGVSPTTPAAYIQNGTSPSQATFAGTLNNLPGRVEAAGGTSPALIIIGNVVECRDSLKWFERRPLFGRTIVVTRPKRQSHDFTERLQEKGAKVIEFPVIDIAPPRDFEPLRQAIAEIGRFDWVIYTSVNGVDAFFRELREQGGDARRLGTCRVAAVGAATSAALGAFGILPDVVPERYLTGALAKELISRFDLQGSEILLPRADIAPDDLARALESAGARTHRVDAYQTIPCSETDALDLANVDTVTFTSTSTVKHFQDRVGCDAFASFADRGAVASIGPATSGQIETFGLPVHIEAQQHTIPGLVDAISDYYSRENSDERETLCEFAAV